MAKRKRDWAWRRLAESGSAQQQPARRPDFIQNKEGRTVRQHVLHATKPAVDRFFAMLEKVRINGDICLVWRGGDTFRVDEKTVTTPARFYFESRTGEKLGDNETLRRGCRTPHCVKHKKRQSQ